MKNILYLILIILSGCLANYQTELELGEGYLFLHDSSTQRTIAGPRGNLIVTFNVRDYKFNNKYIVASQQDINQCCVCELSCPNDSLSNGLEDCENCINNLPLTYWIINKKTQDVLGPLSRKSYSAEINRLHITNDLNL